MNYEFSERLTKRSIKGFLKEDNIQEELNLNVRNIPTILFVILCSFLKHDKCVKELDLYNQPLNLTQSVKFAKMLLQNKTLQRVSVGFGDDDLTTQSMIFETVFETNKTLKSIDFLTTEWSLTNLERMIRGLSKNKTIESIAFNACGMKDFPIFRMITTCGSNVTHLDLDDIKFQGYQAIDIGNCLKDDTKLKSLSLANCNLSQKSCSNILSALLVNKTLTRLILNGNNLKEGGGMIAARVIRENSILEELCMDGNRIADFACIEILSALHANTTLKTLDLCNNHMSDTTWDVAIHAMKNNSTLTCFYIDFQGISFYDEKQKYLKRATLRNLSLYECIIHEWDLDELCEDEISNSADLIQPESAKRQRIN